MIRAKVLLLTIASLLIFSNANVFADGNAVWETWTQSERNRRIIDWAGFYVGQYGGQCKTWIQLTVVPNASQGHVMLPQNNPAPYDYYWQYDPHQHAISMSMPIESAQPGNVVQMHLRSTNGPHTAIVWSIDSLGVVFIESNYNYDGMVRIRPKISFAAFKGQVTGYTVYSIR